jgi:pimeloyl-ACP methyl ester carboxylesterase
MSELWIDADGARLFSIDAGAGHAIVMLHGGMASHVAALPLVRGLEDRHRILVPDLRGSGASWWGGPLRFDQLADDVRHLLDHLSVDRAVVGGVSSGSGVAVRFALRYPERASGLVIVKPTYAGEERGYTEDQRMTLERMDAVARRASDEGIQVLRPLYMNLPAAMREKALAMIETFDAASVVATSRFLVSGAQPFASAADLSSLRMPALLVRGDDPLHPADVSDLYAASLRDCTVLPASTVDVAAEIGLFVDRCAGSGAPAR